jgi:hypothetical protein
MEELELVEAAIRRTLETQSATAHDRRQWVHLPRAHPSAHDVPAWRRTHRSRVDRGDGHNMYLTMVVDWLVRYAICRLRSKTRSFFRRSSNVLFEKFIGL